MLVQEQEWTSLAVVVTQKERLPQKGGATVCLPCSHTERGTLFSFWYSALLGGLQQKYVSTNSRSQFSRTLVNN